MVSEKNEFENCHLKYSIWTLRTGKLDCVGIDKFMGSKLIEQTLHTSIRLYQNWEKTKKFGQPYEFSNIKTINYSVNFGKFNSFNISTTAFKICNRNYPLKIALYFDQTNLQSVAIASWHGIRKYFCVQCQRSYFRKSLLKHKKFELKTIVVKSTCMPLRGQ